MTKIFFNFSFILSISVCVISACSNSSTETEGMDKCSITNITLGTLYKTVTTQTEDGSDTTYTTTYLGSSKHPLLVDQLKHVIYNPDSLDFGTDMKRITFSDISADGYVFRKTTSGIDTIFSTSDTLDFTKSHTFVCYSSDLQSKQTYTIKINAHQINPETFCWTKAGTFNDLKSLKSQKAFVKESTIYVFGVDNATNKPVVLTSPTKGVAAWKKNEISNFVELEPMGIQLFNNKFYTSTNGGLLQSNDGCTWTQIPSDLQPDGLIASTDVCMFAKKGDSLYYSRNGSNWFKDAIDGSASYLPTKEWTSAWSDMHFNSNFEYAILSGTNEKGEHAVWKKVIDRLNQENDCWSHYEKGEEITYPLQNLKNSIIFNYDSKILNLGITGDTLSLFYVSEDTGRNWEPDTDTYIHPDAIKATNFGCAVDEFQYIWITCAGTGEVWKGRINRLSFIKEETSFTK